MPINRALTVSACIVRRVVSACFSNGHLPSAKIVTVANRSVQTMRCMTISMGGTYAICFQKIGMIPHAANADAA